MNIIFFRLILIFTVLCTCFSCGPRSMQDFVDQGQEITREIIKELQKVHSREDLISACPKLKPLFEQLVNVMIAAKQFQEKHPNAAPGVLTDANRELSEDLRQELNRVYSLDGGREIMERCQAEALNRLDRSKR